MSEWKETTLGYFLTFQRGFDITKKQMIEDGIYDVIFSSGIGGKHNEYKIEAHGVVIGRKGTLGTVFYCENRFWATDTTLWVKDFHGNYPKFAYYFLKTLNLGQYDCGSANPTLNRNHIHLLNIKIPVLAEEQKRIADVLSCLDAKIENLRRQNETLENIAQTLFKHWFIDFEFPNADGKPYKSSGGVMVPSELGDIPEGWRVGTLEDVITQANTGADAIQKAPIVNENTGIKCLRIGDITNHRQFEEWGYCKVTKKHFLQYQLKKGDILVTRTSALGLNILLLKDLSAVFNNGLIKIRIKDEINTVFIYSFMQSKRYKEYIARITYETTTRPNMQINYLLDFPLLFVNKDLEDNFSSFALKILLKQDKNNEQIQTLTKIRDSLLPKLMSGQIRVKE
jgi:type I restriction enzyme S subunit